MFDRCRVTSLFIIVVLVLQMLVYPFTTTNAQNTTQYFTPITIVEKSGNDLTNYTVKIVLDSSWDGWNHASNDGSDIYFTDENEIPLYYWIEEFDSSNHHAVIWVKIPYIPANSIIRIKMYYGGSNPHTSYNDPKQAFIYYNDGSTLDFDEYPYDVSPFGAVDGSDSSGWSVDTVNNVITHSVTIDKSHQLAIKDITIDNCCIQADVNLGTLEEIEEAGIVLRYTSSNRYYLRLINAPAYNNVGLQILAGGTTLGTYSMSLSSDTWYTLKLCAYGSHLTGYLNDQLIFNLTDTSITSGYFGVYGAFNNGVSHTFKKIIVRKYVEPEPQVSLSPSVSTTVGGSSYYTPVTVTEQSGSTLTDYTIRIELNSTWDGWDHVASDGSDIYFIDETGNPLYYWIEGFDYANKQATIWVKVPIIQANGQTTIYMYYGGGNPYASYNNPSKVFVFYEDAESYDEGTLNPDGWSIVGSSGFDEVYVTATSVQTHDNINYGSRVIEVKARQTTGSYEDCYVYIGKTVSINAGNYVLDADLFFYYRDYGGKHHAKIIVGSVTVYDGNPFSGTGIVNDWYHLTTEFILSANAQQIKLGHYFNSLASGVPIVAFDNIIIRKYVEPEPKIVLGKSVCTVEVASGTISVTVIGDGFEDVVENPVVMFNVSSRDDYGLKVFVDHVTPFFVTDGEGKPLYYQVVDRGADYVTLAVLLPFLAPGQETHLYIHYGSGQSGFSSFSTDLINTNNVKLVDNVNVTVSVASVSPTTQSKYVVAYIENTGSTDYYYLPVAINLDELGFTDWYGISHNDFRDLQAFYTQKEPVPVWTRCKMWYQLDNNSVIELSVEEGKYYLIPSDFDLVAYYWDGQEYVQIPTYRWDLDTSYIIFQSPVTGQVILRQGQVQGILSTQDWFYLSFDDPYINITFSSPKWQPQTFYKDFYTVTENKTLAFDGTSVIATYNRTLAITKQQVTITVHTTSTFGASETYYAYLHAANMPEGWSAVIAGEQGRATEGSSAYPDWWWSSSKSYVTLSYSIPDATTATVTTSSSIMYYAGLNLDGSDWLITINFTGSPHTYTVTDVCATREGNVMVASNGNVMVFVDDALSNTPIVRARDEPTIIWVVVPYIPADSYTSIVIGYGFDAAPYPDEWGALKVFPYTLINPVTDSFTRIQGSGTIKANMSFGNPLGSLEISSNYKTLFMSEKTFFVDTDYLLVYADVYPADPADIIFGVADESGNIKSTYELTPSTGEWSTLTFPLLIEPNKKYRLVIGIEPVGTQATVYIDNIFVVPYTKNVRVVRLEGTYFSFPPISSPFKQIEQETPAGNMSINIGGGITEPVPENISMVAPYINVSSVPRVGDAGWQGIMAVSMWVAIGIAITRGSRNVYLGAALASAIMVIAGILLGDPKLTVTASIVFVVSYSLSWSRG